MSERLSNELISGKYRRLAMLGEGAMGVVYRAEQLDVKGRRVREVALKMIQPELSQHSDYAERFLREVRSAAQLRSPHIVTVHDFGATDTGQLYFTMELVQGPTLWEVLKQSGPLPVTRAVDITKQVCEALVEAHSLSNPIVHRDLKPGNIFTEKRRGQEIIKVGDFGLAKTVGVEISEFSRLTPLGAPSPGTPAYMAPEQCLGQEISPRTDLYALGVILYELLTGQRPFAGDIQAVMYQHVNQAPPPLPSSLPAGIHVLVERLLAKDPDQRPTDAASIKLALDIALAREKMPVRPVSESASPDGLTGMGDTISADPTTTPSVEEETRSPSSMFKEWPVQIWTTLQGPAKTALLRTRTYVGDILGQRSETWSRRGLWGALSIGCGVFIVWLVLSQFFSSLGLSEMVFIPAGEFPMGCNGNIDKWCENDEKPSKIISLVAFFIDKYEVTVADYRQCVEGGECSMGLNQDKSDEGYNWNKAGQDNYPLNCVNWRQAQTYCEWLGRRLPTESEWEKAARGTEGLVYPWGNTWDLSKANTSEDGAGKITAVGTYPSGVSPYGAYDMAGNVWEWVNDSYRKDAYQYLAKGDKESGVLDGIHKVVRGGSWNNQLQAARTSKRFSNDPDRGNNRLGFRCAKSAE